MAIDSLIQPQDPVMITWDGAGFYVVRCREYVAETGVTMIEMWLVPFDWTKRYLRIQDSELKYQDQFSYGVVIKHYPKIWREILSTNPEKPIWLLICNYAGSEISTTSKELAQLIDAKKTIEILESRVSLLKNEIAKMQGDMRDVYRRAAEKREVDLEFYGASPKEGVRIPNELLSEGFQLDKGKVKK